MITLVTNFSLRKSANNYYVPRPDYDFINQIIDKGRQVNLLSFVAPKDDPFADRPVNEIEGVSIKGTGNIFLEKKPRYKLFFYINALLRTAPILIQLRKTFFYIYFPGVFPIVVALMCRVLGIKYGLYIRGEWSDRSILKIINKSIFKNAEFIFTTGRTFSEIVSEHNENTEPVYPMISFNPFDVPTKKDFPPELSRGLFLGHLKRRKGVLDIVQAVKLAYDAGLEARVDFIGGGSPDDIRDFKNCIEENDVAHLITYHGHVGDPTKLSRYFEEADYFVYPSFYPEGFPRVVFEAMLFQLPIICTILPGMKRFMQNARNCLEVKKNDPEAIADQMVLLSRNYEKRKAIALTAGQDIREYLTSFELKGHGDQFHAKYSETFCLASGNSI
jgi:glycosyltransferase involved in cell wall biosynthesis